MVLLSQASQTVKFSISPMLISNLALVESKKDYSVYTQYTIVTCSPSVSVANSMKYLMPNKLKIREFAKKFGPHSLLVL